MTLCPIIPTTNVFSAVIFTSGNLRWNDRQDDLRRVVAVAIDRVVGKLGVGVAADRFAGVRVDVEAWEVAARHVETNVVAPGEQVARRRELDLNRVDFARYH